MRSRFPPGVLHWVIFQMAGDPQSTSGYWSLTAVGKKLFLRLVLQHWRLHNLLHKGKNSRSQGGRRLPRCWQPFSCGGRLACVQLSLPCISTGEHVEALPTAHLSSLRSLVFFTVMKRLSSLLQTLQMFHLFSMFPLVASQHSNVRRELVAQPCGAPLLREMQEEKVS